MIMLYEKEISQIVTTIKS